MTKKDPDKKRIIGYRKHILACVILLTPGLLALIGFNLLLLYSATNSLLALLVEALSQYVFLINCGLIFYVGFIGIFLAFVVLDYRSFKRKLNARQQITRSRVVARLELDKKVSEAVLRFLTDNEGKAFTSDSLISRINHEGIPERLDWVLSRLVENNKINRTEKDKTQYYSI